MTCESRLGTLLMGAAAVSYGRTDGSYGRTDGRRQALFQWAMVASFHTAAAAAGLCWERWIWERAGDDGCGCRAVAPMSWPYATQWTTP